MTVSGPTNTSSAWAVQPSASTTPTSNTAKTAAASNTFDYLTDADRDLMYAATISFDRQAGRLSTGQLVTATYLKDLARQQAVSGNVNDGGANPFVGEVKDRALAYSASSGRDRAHAVLPLSPLLAVRLPDRLRLR